MALFSKKKANQNKNTSGRVTTSGEAEVAELRVRARRRLLGALVLVVAAIIVVPHIFDDPNTVVEQTPIVLPADIPDRIEPDLNLTPGEPALPEDTYQSFDSIEEATNALRQLDEPESASDQSQAEEQIAPVQSQQDSSAVQSPVTPKKPEPAPKTEQKSNNNARTDDGSLALALLEGRVPANSASSGQTQQGNFILQIAAYSTEIDAIARRDKLIESGVTNAYVEKTVSNGNTAYRLRVGSFTSRDSAQAAQARLRALGYDNSLLISQ